ncbi:AraC family transcriptional regulator [Bradyrhizobium jicamae]|uniref:AraC family transcriptional regulator n=2 Tax=Bradyrhizobium jicamae TaxID=280332 RepID=A0ABS5FSF2_9BRAD|nr:AraC family transcriptional regulator [Bradyrhizobium jicamae]MBR0799722.1 AraC family transcriptional regulator [Bradyrhizobium jicamae]MBR0933099.1 AraC family transcriptional regulator [Bradyrhizobium jicamae]
MRVDDAAEAIGRIFCPHNLTPVEHSARDFFALHNCADFDGFSINYVAYGGAVSINPGCLDRFFLLQIPLHGWASVRTASGEVTTGPARTASLLSPTIPTDMTWREDCAQLILLLDRRLVEHRAAALGGTAVRPVEFDPAVGLDGPLGQALAARIEQLVALAERLGPRKQLPAVTAADWREAFLDALLNGQRHSLSAAIDTFNGRGETQPAALKRVREHLETRATEPIDLAELAGVAGTGIRALQLGFRRHFGTTISDMLLDIRLAQLNARLKTARPGERIVDIAFDLGFTHLSRMASAYRAKFGETPKATLRRPG